MRKRQQKTWDTPIKNMMRFWATQANIKTAKNIIMLPSDSALCIKECISNKLIGKQTIVNCIESEHTPYYKLKDTLKEKPFCNTGIYKTYQTNLDKFYPDDPIDYAFFDMCNIINIDTLMWLHNMCSTGRVSNGCELNFVSCVSKRNSNMLRRYGLKTKYDKLLKLVKDVPSNKIHNVFSDLEDEKMTMAIGITLNSILCSIQMSMRVESMEYSSYKSSKYRMLFVKLKNITKKRSGCRTNKINDIFSIKELLL